MVTEIGKGVSPGFVEARYFPEPIICSLSFFRCLGQKTPRFTKATGGWIGKNIASAVDYPYGSIT